MTNKESVLNLLGLAYRARKTINGEESVINSLSKKNIKMIFVASDASEKTIDKFDKKCFFYKVDLCKLFTTEELSKAIGKTLCKIIAIVDQGFYTSFNKIMKRGETYEI